MPLAMTRLNAESTNHPFLHDPPPSNRSASDKSTDVCCSISTIDSSNPVTANATHDPHWSWSSTGVTPRLTPVCCQVKKPGDRFRGAGCVGGAVEPGTLNPGGG